jgi:hypothetical protein
MKTIVMTELKINYVIYTTVNRVEALGKEPDVEWWVNFEGSWESLCFGKSKPFDKGDNVKITFEKVQPNDKTV